MPVVKAHDYNILIDEESAVLRSFIDLQKPSKVFIIADRNTETLCLPIFKEQLNIDFSSIAVMPGEEYKNLKTCTQLWNALMTYGCDRQSLVINLGGGVVGDMGGFIASTYMRGLRFIQAPTTLLSMVDASVGGKLGIDFLSFKNMVGVFNNPGMVWIQSRFLNTLPERELRSGLAEVFKHALIRSKTHWDTLKSYGNDISKWPYKEIIKDSVEIKNRIVQKDPLEKSLRKILNFGHTIGHAVESHYLDTKNTILHGEAVAVGMVCEAFLSKKHGLITVKELDEITQGLTHFFSQKPRLLDVKEELLERMMKDKKNTSGQLNFSLLNGIGDCVFDRKCPVEDIISSFEYFEKQTL